MQEVNWKQIIMYDSLEIGELRHCSVVRSAKLLLLIGRVLGFEYRAWVGGNNTLLTQELAIN